MLEKLDYIEKRYEQLNTSISDPDIIANQDEWKKLVKEHATLEDIVSEYREYKAVMQGIDDVVEMLQEKPDREFREMLEQEMGELEEKKEDLIQRLKVLLIPKDPNDDKNVVVEIR